MSNSLPVQSLTERVLSRISDASVTDDGLPKVDRRRPSPRSPDARAMRRVFVEMGDAYREYRGRTGAAVSPDVKAAAIHFRQEPNVDSLVSVAARLDELRVLGW
jgi:hypothetical protein